MKNVIQSLSFPLLAVLLVVGCNRDSSSPTSDSTPGAPPASEAPLVESAPAFDSNSTGTIAQSLPSKAAPIGSPIGSPVAAPPLVGSPPTNRIPETADGCVVEARKAFGRLEYQRAMSLCNAALSISPSHPQALYLRGQTWVSVSGLGRVYNPVDLKMSYLDKMLQDFVQVKNSARQGSLYEAMAAVRIGSVLRNTNHAQAEEQLADAFELCNQYLEKQPNDPDCLLSRAIAKGLLGMGAEGAADIQRAISVAPNHLQARATFGMARMNQGSYDEALAVGDELVRRFPDNPNGFGLRSMCWQRKENYDQSLQEAKLAVARSRNTSTLELLAVAYLNTGQTEQALACQLEISKMAPDNAFTHLRLAIVCSGFGRNREALVALEEFERQVTGKKGLNCEQAIRQIKLSTTSAQLKKWKIEGSYSRWSDTKPEQAMATVQNKINSESPSARLFVDCGVECFRVGNFDDALALFDRAIQLDPQNAEAHGRRGVTFHHLKQLEKAREDLLQACQLDGTVRR